LSFSFAFRVSHGDFLSSQQVATQTSPQKPCDRKAELKQSKQQSSSSRSSIQSTSRHTIHVEERTTSVVWSAVSKRRRSTSSAGASQIVLPVSEFHAALPAPTRVTWRIVDQAPTWIHTASAMPSSRRPCWTNKQDKISKSKTFARAKILLSLPKL
jgi:hypothetical protein